MNVVCVRGRLSREPVERALPSGDRLVQLSVTVPTSGGPAETVPVVWPGAPARLSLEEGDEVVVAGRVRRRFFRAGGALGSSTEVVAAGVVPARAAKRAAALVRRALVALEAGEGSP